ncbi:receptor activity-modifying protein 3-like isoform X2 [Pygocentrus nattereri]|uniref:receptor activity-modifying protein 3-like isoform X2 n=1 Tax=Pygocentrus nattereri TaxID=42514 RepID=UPI0018911CD3|nr:receptor activity-modifying protein 3-like isoform X2 [Pygocentrus nattereri]XP_037390078.1 receptor activity-modifying protein 3-like isoform X2 [Pygocentrus nattereri]
MEIPEHHIYMSLLKNLFQKGLARNQDFNHPTDAERLSSGLCAATEEIKLFMHKPWILECNKTVLQLEMEKCGERFKTDMEEVDPQNWCNLTHFIGEYHFFSACTEDNAVKIGCFWPNPVVEHYIIRIHKQFFSNCTLKSAVWGDPSEDTLIILILVPVFLTLTMVALVVWCSKRSDILA